MALSVIIPTYKRTPAMLQALHSLQTQSLEDFEIVLVDNTADPDVARAVTNFNRDARVAVTYIPEPRLGAHHARHAGARAAMGDVFLFVDDDQSFDRGWAAAYAKAFTLHPEMIAAAGPIKPRWDAPPPAWVEHFIRGRAIFPILGLMDISEDFRIDRGGVILSGNMAIRRQTFFELGGFGPDLFGESLLGNGETGLNHKLWQRGLLIGYVPEAIAYHHIPSERMTVAYFKLRMANEGACDMYTRFHRHMPGQLGLVACAVSVFLRNCVGWLIAAIVNGRTDRLSLQVQLQASRSRAQVTYISRLIKDKEFRKFVLKQDWLNASCTSP